MIRWFKKKLNLDEQYRNLKNINISLINDVSLQQITDYSGNRKYKDTPYLLLLIDMGSEIQIPSGEVIYPSHDIWYLDRECIEDHGDYCKIVKRVAELMKGEVEINHITDYVDIESEICWISFEINGKHLKFELIVDDDWLDLNIFKLFSELLEEFESKRRFYYSDLGQGILVGAYRKEQWMSLNQLINIFLPT
ncbi:hypothetical protein LOZ80_12995 [Paenibacillus sp. HWE-109]|uniref:hypothetical protein n=1 Tax=Paenibacillus sp. HWE-109 TaxID=1306526 RepID=UPI001EDCED24|nr:hypothetical protein [Paenibacillus sp. HWE-109]UKS29790.1 hypothetical protein LOZ80_12995 [Paenibacillus sp. HWE-109]